MLLVYEQNVNGIKQSPEIDSDKYGHLTDERFGMANQQRDEFLRGGGANLYTYLIPNTKLNSSRRQNYHILKHSTEDIHDLRIEKCFFNNTLKHQQDGKRLMYFTRSRKINCEKIFEIVITKGLIS